MSEQTRLILIVLAMAAVTYLPRSLPLQFDVRKWPPWVRASLEYLPPSILAAIVVPSLLPLEDGHIVVRSVDLIAAALTAACACATRNLLISVVVGTVAYLALA